MINKLDRNDLIRYRLYRQHTVQFENNYNGQLSLIKDLSRIGRPLERTIIIDNLKENFCWQKQNGIHIKTWHSDIMDEELALLIPVLKALAESECADVRPFLSDRF